jgi:geranylgeranyl reductase family protein
MSDFTTVAVVGAGPAGTWAAYTLACRGARVTIFDGSHPREKPCGGGVTGRALALVDIAVAGASLPVSRIRRARFIDSSARRSVTVELEPGIDAARGIAPEARAEVLVVASRAAFDGALLSAAQDAGATLVRARVSDVGIDAGGVRLETTAGSFRAGFLIGADGTNSLVRRRLAQPFRRGELSIATGYFAHGVTNDEIAIEFTKDPPGYVWSFPRPTHLAIGICAQADAGVTAAALRERAAAWIRGTGIAAGAALEPYSWPIPSPGVAHLRQLEVAGPNWCLAGDAAGLVDPLTREGIYFSLDSGAWAADAALANDSAGYAARVRADLFPELARGARLRDGFFRLASTDLLLRALEQSAQIRDVMADLIAGRQGYRGLKRRLLKTMEWKLAWRLLAAVATARNSRRAPGLAHRVA